MKPFHQSLVAAALLAVTAVLSGCSTSSTAATPVADPSLTLSTTSLIFPTTVVGTTTAAKSVTLTNTGNVALTISAITLGGANTSAFALSNACGASLAVNATCVLNVTFTPSSTTSFSATVSVMSSASATAESILLSGAGYVANYPGIDFSGVVMAGNLPVIGATVQLYAAGATGNGSVPAQMLATGVVTNASGVFTITAPYTCPFSTSVLYLVATGGHAGASGAANTGTVLMTSPGACSAPLSSSTYTLNELTTVASAYAFAQFLAPGALLGSTSSNIGGLTLAAGTLANLVNISTGAAPGPNFPTTTGTPPTARLNALANLLNACITSNGAGSTACTTLYSDTTSGSTVPANTLDAVLSLAKHPSLNVSALFTASAASSAYSPVPTVAPTDWTMFVTYTGGGMNSPSGVAIDSVGRIWVASYFAAASLFSNTGVPAFANGIGGNGLCYSYGAAVDANDNAWIPNEPGSCGSSSVSVLTPAGVSAPGAPYTAGGLNFPLAVAIDRNNNGWVVNYGNSTVTLLNNAGTPQSGASGFNGIVCSQPVVDCESFIFPDAVAVDSKGNAYIGNQSASTIVKVAPDGSSFTSFNCCDGATGLAVDGSDNVWTANYYGNSVGLVSSAGVILSGRNGFTPASLYKPQGIAIDGIGNVWVVNYRSTSSSIGDALTELAGASTATPGSAISPSIGWGTDAGMQEAYGLAIDASGNIWVSSFATNALVQYIGMAPPVKTPLLGPVRIP